MDSLRFTVLTNPVAKARARTCIKNGYVHSYTPKATADAESEIQQVLYEQCGVHAGQCYFGKGTALKVTLAFYIAKPKSAKKRVYHTVKSDLDNFCKTVLDSLNDRVYADDSQIVELHATKAYGSPPRVEIEVAEI
jgi:Holliday junction resolvase RusA-like endonuclease